MTTVESFSTARHEYRMKGWYRSMFLILGAPSIAGGVIMSSLAFKGAFAPLRVFMILAFLFFGVYLVALATRSRVIIEGTRIEIRGAITDRFADINEIHGYRTISSRNGRYTQFYLNNGGRPLTLANHFDKDSAFDSWIRKVPDLDKRDRDTILEKISQETSPDSSPQQRLAQAKTYSIFALVIAITAGIAANYGIPSLYLAFSVALALVPVALAILIHRAPLLYTVFKRKDDPRAELLYALIASSFALLIRARGIHFVSIESIGLVVALLTLAFLAAFYHSFLESPYPTRTFFALLFFSILYSYSAVAVTDAVADQSKSTRYTVSVVDKHYTTGRSRSYYLDLEPWGPMQQTNRLGVSKTIYDRASPGDQVCLELRPGRLNATWYTQVSCTSAPLDAQSSDR
jgi:hypothetical protein